MDACLLKRMIRRPARIQSRLLPERKLRHAGWEVYYHYEPAGPVGGDYCDLVQADSGELFFFVGDASGIPLAADRITFGGWRPLVRARRHAP